MSEKLHIQTDMIGRGKERTCYLHPADPSKLVKISGRATSIQSRREISFYKKLARNNDIEYLYLPRYYGEVDTNLGNGFVVDTIVDHDGEISKSLQWYLTQGARLKEFEMLLMDVYRYFYSNLIIFNDDISAINVLVQKGSPNCSRLVVIDGFGDSVYITLLNIFPGVVRGKIHRRWHRFLKRLNDKFE